MDNTPLKEVAQPHLRPMAPIPTGLSVRGTLKPPIEGLLCDIYGTLFISGSGDLNIARQQTRPLRKIGELLTRHGVSIPPNQLIEKLFAAMEQHHQAARAKGISYPEVCIEQIWSQLLPMKSVADITKFAIEYEMVVNPVWPMPHMAELLAACRQRDIRLGIISNAQFFTPYLFDWIMGKSMATLGFHKELIFFSFEWGEAKPSERLYQAAVQRLETMGIDPQRTAYIGNDMRKDIIPAAKAGLQTVLFAGDARSLRTCEADPSTGTQLPDLVVTDLQQLLMYLER